MTLPSTDALNSRWTPPIQEIEGDSTPSGAELKEALRRDSKFPWYLGLIGLYAALTLGMAGKERRGSPLDSPSLLDLGSLALASFQSGRVLALDEVTRPLRAPFVCETRKDGEPHEDPRSEGWRGALGELLLCADCTSFWASVVLVYGYMLAPKTTRVVAAPLAVSALATLLNDLSSALKAGGDSSA